MRDIFLAGVNGGNQYGKIAGKEFGKISGGLIGGMTGIAAGTICGGVYYLAKPVYDSGDQPAEVGAFLCILFGTITVIPLLVATGCGIVKGIKIGGRAGVTGGEECGELLGEVVGTAIAGSALTIIMSTGATFIIPIEAISYAIDHVKQKRNDNKLASYFIDMQHLPEVLNIQRPSFFARIKESLNSSKEDSHREEAKLGV